MYHVNQSGSVGICRASKAPCPFGGADVHFESKEAAAKAFEDSMGSQIVSVSRTALYSRESLRSHEAATPNSSYRQPEAFSGSFEELQAEIAEVGKLLHSAVNEDESLQAAMDAELEARNTSVGLRLAQEAEQRSGIDREALRASLEDSDNRDELIKEAVDRLTKAHRDLIAELRPVGGKLNLADTPDENRSDALRMLQETVEKDYPTAWLDASNASGERLRLIGIGMARASYSNHEVQNDLDASDYPQFAEIVPEKSYYIAVPVGELEQTAALLGPRARIIDAPAYEEPSGLHKVLAMPMELIYEPENMESIKNEFPLAGEPDFRPRGDGWEWAHYIDAANDKVSKEKTWVKPVKDVQKVYMDALKVGHPQDFRLNPYDTEPKTPEPLADSYKRTTYHEFGHRVERTVANGAIMRMEHAFLKRRTTDPVTGEQEPMSYVYPPREGQSFLSVERGRRNSFIAHYMGKEYVDSPAREVFTVGLESVFGGTYEALSGISSDRTNDQDMKGFILGLLATA